MPDSIAVVIPFYQKRTGILRKAIDSALAQKDVAPFKIIIVDDASPVSARSELADLLPQYGERILIIEQANAGPAAARNKGLDNVPAGTEFVAFLDSDDEWIDSHLANAVKALGNDLDFYFSDHYQLKQTVSAFKRGGRIDTSAHPQIGGETHLHRYIGDMFDQILMGNIIGTSTVVYRFAKFPALRFREEYVYAGEDYLFWLELAAQTKHIAFSSLCECTYGEGVNIFAGSGWGTEKSLIRLHYEMKYKKALPRLFGLNSVQLRANRETVKHLRRSFLADLLHRISHRRPIGKDVIHRQFTVDPQTFYYSLPLMLQIVFKR